MRNILCIDDIESNLFVLESVLQDDKNESYNVLTALSAHAGLDILLRSKVDIILLDVMMPEVDGFLCAQMIKSNKKTKDIPIIFVTAKKDDDTIDKCYAVGGADYVNKPFNSVELLARVSFHLRFQDKTRLLEEEKKYVQNILDLQENLIIVTDGKKALNANKALLNFFGLRNFSEFQSNHVCIDSALIKEDGYFHLDSAKKNSAWIDEVVELSKKEDVLVKIKGASKESVFTLKITNFNDFYILNLTDVTKISKLSDEYERAANFDNLTQIYNRNMLHSLLNKKINSKREKEDGFVLMMLDIDFFKKVNDAYGHLVGDEVLKGISQVVKKHIRADEIFARWGGEEFVLVVNVGIQQGMKIAENLRKYVEAEDFGVAKEITCSFGITEFMENDTLDTLIKRADDALYKAKETGRNKVCQG